MNLLTCFRSICVVLTITTSAALAQSTQNVDRYSQLPASADGIGKSYMGREIAAVMGWQGAAWLERQERDREERTDLLLAALMLQPGFVVADIGAGSGYHAFRIAPLVPQGRVVAVDIQPEMLTFLQSREPGLSTHHIHAWVLKPVTQ